jgi:Dimerisation domain
MIANERAALNRIGGVVDHIRSKRRRFDARAHQILISQTVFIRSGLPTGKPKSYSARLSSPCSRFLAKKPLTSAALASRIGTDVRGARDFFDALVAPGLLCRDKHDRYRNSETTGLYLDRCMPTYLGGSFVQYNSREGMWGSLTEALRAGRPRTELHGQGHFETARTILYGSIFRRCHDCGPLAVGATDRRAVSV